MLDPAPTARMKAHGESALVFVLRAWVKSDDYWDLHYDLTEAVKRAFDENGIEIPFRSSTYTMVGKRYNRRASDLHKTKRLEELIMFVPRGNSLPDDAAFCGACGTQLASATPVEAEGR
ncbi:MAG: hypothetical protein ACLUFV_10760 [Acutalibacteraceae bacterium]